MSNLPTSLIDGDPDHTDSHNDTNTQVNINSRPATVNTVTHSSAGALALDATDGHIAIVTVEADITSFSVSNLTDGLPFLLMLVGDGVTTHEADLSAININDTDTINASLSVGATARLQVSFTQYSSNLWAPGGLVTWSATESAEASGISLVGTADVAYVGNFTSTLAVPLPTGIVAGDLIEILVSTQYDPVRPDPSTPTGYTQRWDAGGDTGWRPRVAKFYKIANGTESGTVTINWSESVRPHGISHVFRGVDQTTPYDVAAPAESVGSANPNPPGGTTVTDNCWAIAYCAGNKAGGTTATISSGYTELVNQDDDDRSIVSCYFAMGAAGSENPGGYTWNTDNSTAMTDYLRPAT